MENRFDDEEYSNDNENYMALKENFEDDDEDDENVAVEFLEDDEDDEDSFIFKPLDEENDTPMSEDEEKVRFSKLFTCCWTSL